MVWCHQPVIYAAKTVLNCGGIVKKWGILPSFPTLLRHFSVLDRPRSDLLEAGKPIQDASAPVRHRKSKECIQNGPKKPRCEKARSQSTALAARQSAALGKIDKIENLRPGKTQRKIVRKMPRLFTPNWTSAAFRHRLSSTSLKGWAVYALSESP